MQDFVEWWEWVLLGQFQLWATLFLKIIFCQYQALGSSQVVLVVKNLPANTGDLRDAGSILGWGRSPGGGHGNPLQYSCLENPMDREPWQAMVHGVAKGWTWLSDWDHQALGVARGLFSLLVVARSMWGLVPWPKIKPGSPAFGVLCFSYWATREVPGLLFWMLKGKN